MPRPRLGFSLSGPTPRGRPGAHSGWAAAVVAALIGLGLLRIVLTYGVFSQTTDEAMHVATGMEWLERGRYTLETLHPPLARVATAAGPYLAGRRLGDSGVALVEGNRILHADGEYTRTLALARAGILPFFVLASVVVWRWTMTLFGSGAALMAVLLFTTLPPVLAHAGLATTDTTLVATLALALVTLHGWLERPTHLRAAWLGGATGLALLSKFSALMFLPVSGTALVLCHRLDRSRAPGPASTSGRMRQICLALAVACLVLWGGYRFAVGPAATTPPPHVNLDELVGRDGWLHARAYRIVEAPWLPAPGFLQGLRDVRYAVQRGRLSYLLGEVRWGGFWLFFPVAVAVKTPLPFLILAGGGALALGVRAVQRRAFVAVGPVVAAVVVVLVSMPSRINLGLRHVLPVYALLAPAAGYAAASLWRSGRWPWRVVVAALLGWQVVGGAAVHPDYLAYFNELAHREPDHFLVDSDLDWGQDLGRLERAVRARGVTALTIGYLGSADLPRHDFPRLRQLEPDRPVTGWIAVSEYWVKVYQGRLGWLTVHEPVERVGRSIRLYFLPPQGETGPASG